MTKRVLMVAYTEYVSDSRVKRAAEALTDHNYDVLFLGLSEKGMPRKNTLHSVNIQRCGFYRYRGRSNLGYLFSYFRFFIFSSLQLAKHYRASIPTVIYIHTIPDLMIFAGCLLKFLGVKIILDLHDMMPEIYMARFNVSEKHFFIRLLHLQERMSMNFADAIICVHELQRLRLLKNLSNPRDINVILNLPDEKIFGAPKRSRTHSQVSKSHAKITLVYHGTIFKRGGIDSLIEAMKLVVERFSQIKLIIIGSGDYSVQIENLILSLSLNEYIDFPNITIAVEEIPQILRQADIGIVPYPKCLQMDRALPVKLLEYVHYGIPVITTRLETVEYYFGEKSFRYIESNDPQELADAILELCSSEEKRIALATNASRFSDNYSWDKQKQTLLSVIDSCFQYRKS